MCGLTVLISHHLQPEVLCEATRMIRHRGPDDEGFLLANDRNTTFFSGYESDSRTRNSFPCIEGTEAEHYHIGLGHRRLAIIDPSPDGRQPMGVESGRIWVVFNGEIYNYLELIEELQDSFLFRTQTDTEVLLAAYLKWGESMLDRLNGMFAFAIYDHAKHHLFFARDRYGIKPLYFWRSPSGDWMAASEIKQFTVHPQWHPSLNGQMAYDFLNWGISDHTSQTMFDQVIQLSPGHMISIEVARLLELKLVEHLPFFQWYNLPQQTNRISLGQATRRFKSLFEDSIRLRLRADVPVGSCLSGGLDSSSVVCLSSKLLDGQGDQKSFTACAHAKLFDERKWAEAVAQHAGTNGYYVYPELDDLFSSISKITWHQDEPFGSTSIYAQWQVFALAAKHGIKVMLDGQGADEQLAGYHIFLRTYLAELASNRQWRTWWDEVKAIRKLHDYKFTFALSGTIEGILPNNLRNVALTLLGKARKRPHWMDLDTLNIEAVDTFEKLGTRTNSVQKLSLAQLSGANLQMLLHWEDRDSMAHSIEARVPFLDYRFVEFVLSLPPDYKIRHGLTKYILREAIQDILPEKIRMRVDKLGFVTPEEIWMKTNRKLFQSKVENAIEQSQGILKPMAIKIFNDIINGKKPFSFLPWRMINFGKWMEIFGVSIS